MKKHIVFPFILCMCMFLTSCGVKMTGVKIQNVGELTTGDRQSLVLDYEFNHDGSDKEKEKVIDKTQLIFSSDNMSVANIVGDGKTILAGTGGTATITVRSLDGTIHDSINVTVLARPKEFSIPHELTLTLGSEEVSTITPTVQPEDFDYSGCEYSSSNEGVVTVDQDGNLTPVSAGTASVYAKLPKLNIERECKVTVIAPIEKITLSKSDASINAGEMVKLSCTTYPETPDTSILQWSTSDSSIATVDASGTVTGVGKGIAFIKVSYKDVYAVCAVSVNKKESETKTDGSLPQGSGAHNDWYRHGDSSTFDALLKAVNKYRQDNGIPALQEASSLTAVANQRADSMVDGSNTVSGYKELLAQNGRAAILWYVEDEGIIEKPESLKTAAEIKQEEKDAKKAAKLEKKKQKEYLSTLGPKERKIAKARFKAQALEKAERDRKRREEELRIYNEAIAKREKEEAEKAKEEQTLSQLEKDMSIIQSM